MRIFGTENGVARAELVLIRALSRKLAALG
jgi:hypothetical protein